MATNISPNMSLPVPVVGVEPGPDYATDVNNSLTIIDQHTHAPGSGVQITPDGLNINSDLAIGSNNLIGIRSSRYASQSSPLALSDDLQCVYVTGVDLYYNDGNGNQVRITQSGGIAGSPGSISNLTSPASATYVAANGTFVWQSDANKAADMDMRSAILRNASTSSFGLTLSPPTLSSNYALTLPSIPASQKFMTLDASGAMSAPWAVDGSTIVVSSSTVKVPDGGIDTAQLADASVTQAKLAAKSIQAGSSTGAFTTTSATYVGVESVTITCTGRPVVIVLQSDKSGGASGIGVSASGGLQNTASFQILRDGATSCGQWIVAGYSDSVNFVPPSSILAIDTPPAGAHTYNFYARVTSGATASVTNVKVTAYEL